MKIEDATETPKIGSKRDEPYDKIQTEKSLIEVGTTLPDLKSLFI